MTTFQSLQQQVSQILVDHPELSDHILRLNIDMLVSSFRNITMSPERRAISTVRDYVSRCVEFKTRLSNAINKAKEQGGVIPDRQAVSTLIEDESKVYNSKICSLMLDYVNAESRCANWMVTGPARFPVERNRKRMATAQSRYEKISEVSDKIYKSALRRILPEGDGSSISSASNSALEQLESSLAAAQKEHQYMKDVNKIVRKFYPKGASAVAPEVKTSCIESLMKLIGMSYEDAETLLKPCRLSGVVLPFPSYKLTNNNARIRQIEGRITEQKRLEDTRQSNSLNGELDNGIKYFITSDNRIAVDFGFKPDQGIRDIVKGAHFKFSPKRGNLWVRKHTQAAEYDFINGVLPHLEGLTV